MPRELMEAVAMAPTASNNATFSVSLKSLPRFFRNHELEVKVLLAWLLWYFLRLLQSFLGPRRRRSGHGFVQYGARAAYYLPTLVVFYTANAVYSSDSDVKVILSLGCCFLLILCARGPVTMTAFTLDHGPTRLENWRLLPWLLYFAWLQLGFVWRDRKLTAKDVYYILVIGVAPVFYVLCAKPRVAVLDYETKKFADHMMPPFFSDDAANSSSLLYDRCRYPFKLPDGRWISFSDVLQTRDCAVDPDICLSYSFCRLLARRYFGFPCAEDGSAQVRDFVLTELLLAENDDHNNNNRAFAIVEVQLAMLHDYFFTSYHSRITSGVLSVKQVIVRGAGSILGTLVGSVAGDLLNGRRLSDLLKPINLCVSVLVVVFMYSVIEQPRSPVLPPYWHPIRNLFLNYPTDIDDSPSDPCVTQQSASSRRRQSSGKSYWRDKMGQYSVMEDYDRRSYMTRVTAWCKVHVLSQVSYSFIKHHPAEGEDVKVPDSLKRSVARAIQGINNGQPTMGTRSLRVHGLYDDLSWTCTQETLTDTILIWHIATFYCDMSQPLEEEIITPRQSQDQGIMSQPLEEPSTGYRRVARTLSGYCAYLVAFLPELLPEHSMTAKFVLQQVLQEAKDLLERTRVPVSVPELLVLLQHVLQEPGYLLGRAQMYMEAKRSKIRELELQEDESSLTTFQKGVRLGRQLEHHQQDDSLRWKAMADFWAEMIVYVASSPDNAAAHVEQLAQGGEFLTHLWALLCNAGIVMKRAADQELATSS